MRAPARDLRGGVAPAATTDDDAATPRGALSLRAIALVSGATVALHLPALVFRLFNSDEASLATIAMVINRGGRLYHQTADRKPPIVPYLYALVFRVTGSTDLRPVRAVAVAALAATACLLAWEAGRRYRSRRAAVLCGLLFACAVVTFFPPDTQAAGYEVFMLLPMTAAVVAAARGRSVQAGVWLAVACLCKQTAVTTALPIAYLLLRTRDWRACVRAGIAALAVVLVTALLFGPAQFLLWTVTGNGGYLVLRGSWGDTLWRGFVMSGSFIGLNIAIVGLCVWAAVRGGRRDRDGQHDRPGRRETTDLWLWVLAAVLGIVPGLRFFGHYYLQLYPPLVLLATGVLVEVPTLVRRGVLALAVSMAAATALAAGLFPPAEIGVLPYGAVAARLRALTTPNERVFVWGEYPELYWAARRQPATRFVHTGFLTGNSGGRPRQGATSAEGIPGAWGMLALDFASTPPAMVLDTTNAKVRGSQYYPLTGTPIWPVIANDYRVVAELDGVLFYRRISGSTTSGSG